MTSKFAFSGPYLWSKHHKSSILGYWQQTATEANSDRISLVGNSSSSQNGWRIVFTGIRYLLFSATVGWKVHPSGDFAVWAFDHFTMRRRFFNPVVPRVLSSSKARKISPSRKRIDCMLASCITNCDKDRCFSMFFYIYINSTFFRNRQWLSARSVSC